MSICRSMYVFECTYAYAYIFMYIYIYTYRQTWQLPRNDRMAEDAATRRAIREVPVTYRPEGLTMLGKSFQGPRKPVLQRNTVVTLPRKEGLKSLSKALPLILSLLHIYLLGKWTMWERDLWKQTDHLFPKLQQNLPNSKTKRLTNSLVFCAGRLLDWRYHQLSRLEPSGTCCCSSQSAMFVWGLRPGCDGPQPNMVWSNVMGFICWKNRPPVVLYDLQIRHEFCMIMYHTVRKYIA